ncbi:hypothetical protein MNBD_NITROSPINAE01-1463 [hydrothermal vent metagenome]|uniref:Oxaloacetate decarboxylase gamma chain n=1 Tax=hydrothermal vent metagenome TaxID=652676 RepID=A0A3B1BA40_9ZZZZ
MENLDAALTVTVIGMGIIFLVLILLMGAIMVLNRVFPYVAPVPEVKTASDDGELVAVIQAGIAAYLKRKPEDVSIKSIK